LPARQVDHAIAPGEGAYECRDVEFVGLGCAHPVPAPEVVRVARDRRHVQPGGQQRGREHSSDRTAGAHDTDPQRRSSR